ncbi:MAG: flagellar type III secretion system pore protein FliP [Cyanobacteria bacterium]|jgi:flagellar biosynthesis protein FliP|nr:flagellar type III secretion system pore protein FliP [Cyanobacteriota bacterium]
MEATVGKLDPALQLIILMGSLSLIPFVIVSMTSFLRYIIVLSILKTALGTQQVPPAIVLVGMALVLTFYTMGPVFGEMYNKAAPEINQKHSVLKVFKEGSEPLKEFMMRQTRQSDIAFFVEMNRNEAPNSPRDLTLWEVAPAFMISELRTAFEIGFVIFIPFVVLDLVVSNILLALGMMMLSPTIISLPFKILIFVAVDGWSLIVNGLVQSFN